MVIRVYIVDNENDGDLTMSTSANLKSTACVTLTQEVKNSLNFVETAATRPIQKNMLTRTM